MNAHDPRPSPDELARRSLRRMLADLADEPHWAIENGLTTDELHSIVGLWEANNNNEDLTYESLVEQAKPTFWGSDHNSASDNGKR